jgi:phosphoribosylpyrophosphate synthetase
MITLIDNDSPIEFMNFPDGESFVKFDYNNRPINILWQYENDAEFMTLAQMYNIMVCTDRDARMPKNLLIPYLPHARQDRAATSNQPEALAMAMMFLHNIVMDTNTKVFILDAHSLEFAALEKDLRNLDITQSIDSDVYSPYLQNEGYDAIICPDKGARRRASLWYDAFLQYGKRVDFIECTKVRDPNTGNLSEPKLEEVYEKRLIKANKALLVDDIGTGFGTHIQLGKVLKKINPNLELDLFVTHSSFTRGKEPVLEIFNKVYTTNSLPQGLKQQDDRIIRFDCTEFLPKV